MNLILENTDQVRWFTNMREVPHRARAMADKRRGNAMRRDSLCLLVWFYGAG
jgi:hypothetical protein